MEPFGRMVRRSNICARNIFARQAKTAVSVSGTSANKFSSSFFDGLIRDETGTISISSDGNGASSSLGSGSGARAAVRKAVASLSRIFPEKLACFGSLGPLQVDRGAEFGRRPEIDYLAGSGQARDDGGFRQQVPHIRCDPVGCAAREI